MHPPSILGPSELMQQKKVACVTRNYLRTSLVSPKWQRNPFKSWWPHLGFMVLTPQKCHFHRENGNRWISGVAPSTRQTKPRFWTPTWTCWWGVKIIYDVKTKVSVFENHNVEHIFSNSGMSHWKWVAFHGLYKTFLGSFRRLFEAI